MLDEKLIKSKEQRNNTLKNWLLCRGLHQKNNEKKIHMVNLSKGNFQDYTSLKELTEDWHLNLFCEASETNSKRNSNKEILLPMTNLLMEKRELEWFIYKKDLKNVLQNKIISIDAVNDVLKNKIISIDAVNDVLKNKIISIDAVNNQFEKPSAETADEDLSYKRSKLNRRTSSIKRGRSFQYHIKSLFQQIENEKYIIQTKFNDEQERQKAQEKLRILQSELNKTIKKYIEEYGKEDSFKTFVKEDFKVLEIRDMVINFKNGNIKDIENITQKETETEDKTIDTEIEENKLVKIDKEYEKKILASNNVKIYFKAKPLHKNENREYGTVKSFEPVYHEFDKMPENTFAYNTFISFFNSKNPFVIIPFFADISDIESIEKLVYYYKSKANQLQIDILINNSAQEEIDNLYENVVTKIVTNVKGLGKTINDNEAFLCGQVKKGDLNKWESKYKDTMKKILDNGRIDEKMKSILKHFIKQRFTKWFIQYKNKFEVSLTKINLYYE